MPRYARDAAFGSRLGRRLLLMLLLATLVPISALAVLADGRVAAVLRDARDLELAQHAKTYAIGVFDRLLMIDAAMRDIDTAEVVPAARTRLAAQVGGALSAVAWLDGRGRIVDRVGEMPAWPDVGEILTALAEPGSARTALLTLPDGRGLSQLALIHSRRDSRGRFLAAVVAPEYLWGEATLNPVMTEFCVLSGDTRLYCPAAVPERLDVGQERSERRNGLVWQAGGQAQRGAAWSLFVRSRFASDDWTVLAVQPESYATAPIRAFRGVFVPVALVSLCAVLWLAAWQVRHITVPVRNLLRETERLAERDFGARVAVTSDDELGQLAGAFNGMAGRLALQFRTLQNMARIDRAILKSVDLDEVAVNSLRSLRHIVESDIISIGLIKPSAPSQLSVHTRRRGGRHIERFEIPWPTHARIDIGSAADLPDEYRVHLAANPASSLRALPVAMGGEFWGVVVLGDRGDATIDADRAAMLSGVVDRLAVALSTAARDWRLHLQAHFDPLTGLPNRPHLLGLLTQNIAQARRDGQRGAVLFLDLDRFKQTNDTMGHAAGDRLLRLAAERVRGALRQSDSVARIGGDEFAVILPRIAAAADAGQVASQLVKALSSPFDIEGQTIYVGGSVGIAVYPDDGGGPEDLLKRADTAMYRAKELGRGRYAFFQESMGLELSARAALDRDLRQAVERAQFLLHYQPQIDLRTGEIACAEALLRWQHPVRGLLGPGEFIAFAEESGLIEAIGRWVVTAACEQHRQWEARGIHIPRVAINVSNRQLNQPAFCAEVELALAAAGRGPEHLEVEITESMVVDGGDTAIRALRRLQDAGVRVAIDDFGTGYSSLAYLRTIPASILKLDRSFVIDVARNRDAEAIAASIIRMAQTLRKEVVVEGVEEESQLALMLKHGADRLQGYLVSRPLAPAEFENFVRNHTPAAAAAQRPWAAPPPVGTQAAPVLEA